MQRNSRKPRNEVYILRPLGGNTYYEVDVKDRLGVPLNHDLSNNCIVEQISAYIVHVEHQGEPIAPPPPE